MASKIIQLSWSQLRGRREHPPCVMDVIPAEDLHSFAQLVAINPFLKFEDTGMTRSKLLSIRHVRADLANYEIESRRFIKTYGYGLSSNSNLGRRRRESSAPLHEEKPSQSRSSSPDFSYDESEGSDGRRQRKQRRRTTVNSTQRAAVRLLTPPRGGGGGNRTYFLPNDSMGSLSNETSSSNSSDEEERKAVPQGERHQVHVDDYATYSSKLKPRGLLPECESKLVFSTKMNNKNSKSELLKLKEEDKQQFNLFEKESENDSENEREHNFNIRLDRYVEYENKQMMKKTGFTLTPFTLELVYQLFFSYNGNLKRIHLTLWSGKYINKQNGYCYYPSCRLSNYTFNEYCEFTRCLYEYSKNFSKMSKSRKLFQYNNDRNKIFQTNRSHLVWIYYLKYKQWKLQNGYLHFHVKNSNYYIVDNGKDDEIKKFSLSAYRSIEMLHCLARSRDDGFLTDHRLSKLIHQVRLAKVQGTINNIQSHNHNSNNISHNNPQLILNLPNSNINNHNNNNNVKRKRASGGATNHAENGQVGNAPSRRGGRSRL